MWKYLFLSSVPMFESETKVAQSCLPLWNPCGPIRSLELSRLDTEVGSLSLLQGIFPTQGLRPSLPHYRQILYQLSHTGSSRILECIVNPFSRVSSQPRNLTGVSCNWRWILCQLSYQGSPPMFKSPYVSNTSWGCFIWSLVIIQPPTRWCYWWRIHLQCRRHKQCRFNPWVGKISWRRAWQPTPVFWPGGSTTAEPGPWHHKESDTTEANYYAQGLMTSWDFQPHTSVSLGPAYYYYLNSS